MNIDIKEVIKDMEKHIERLENVTIQYADEMNPRLAVELIDISNSMILDVNKYMKGDMDHGE